MDDEKPISRRELFRSKFGKGFAESLGYALGQMHGVNKHIEKSIREPLQPPPPPPAAAVYLRPPGAIDEISFAAQCTKCNACIEVCPPQTLVKLTSGDGVFGKAFETPVIDPTLGGCTMCDDRPCAKACVESGVDILELTAPMKMGHAMIHRSACRSHLGNECTLCLDVCPVPGAIAQDWRKIPVVDQEVCTGCGMCAHACPVDPIAISIIPTKDRPPKPVQPDHDQNGQGPSPD